MSLLKDNYDAKVVPENISSPAEDWEDCCGHPKNDEKYIEVILGNLKSIASSGGEGYANVILIIKQFTSLGLRVLEDQLEKWENGCGLGDYGTFILATVKEALSVCDEDE